MIHPNVDMYAHKCIQNPFDNFVEYLYSRNMLHKVYQFCAPNGCLDNNRDRYRIISI